MYPRVKITKIQQVFKLNQNQSSLEERNRIVDGCGKAIISIIVTDKIERPTTATTNHRENHGGYIYVKRVSAPLIFLIALAALVTVGLCL